MTGGEGGGWAAAVLGFVEGWFWIADPGLRRGRNELGGGFWVRLMGREDGSPRPRRANARIRVTRPRDDVGGQAGSGSVEAG
jgi:hypothetical protein